MIKNVIFDIGNVLVDFHPIPYFQRLLPKSDMSLICPLIFDSIWEQIDEGRLTCEQAKRKHIQRHPQYTKEIEYVYAHWKEMMALKEDTYAYFKECQQRGFHVFLLSNIGAESHQYLSERYTFFDDADGAILSYQHRCIKPDVRIYQLLIKRYRLNAEECVFFDDNLLNIQNACALGMKGILFENCTQAQWEAALW